MDLVFVKREVNQDNSCLFSSVAYLVDRDNFDDKSGLIFRKLVVDYIKNNDKYDTTFLGLEKSNYIEYISDPKNWGGEIELLIMSEYFEIEICRIDVENPKINVYGKENKFDKRIYILFSGYHYDPLVATQDLSLPFDCDITTFEFNDIEIEQYFLNYANELKNDGQFIQLANGETLICKICNVTFIDQNKAADHGMETGHWNFGNV